MVSIQRDFQDVTLNIDLDLARDLNQISHHPQVVERLPARDMAGHLIACPSNQVAGQLSQQHQHLLGRKLRLLRLVIPRPCLLSFIEVSTPPPRKS